MSTSAEIREKQHPSTVECVMDNYGYSDTSEHFHYGFMPLLSSSIRLSVRVLYHPLPRPRPLARNGLPLPRPRPRPRFVIFSPGTFVLFSFTYTLVFNSIAVVKGAYR